MSPVNAPASIGKEYNLCLGHCLAKLLRQVFAVWTKDCDFDPDFESRPQAIAESATNESVAEEFLPTDPAACEMKTVVGHKQAVKPHRKVVTTAG